MEQAYLDSCPDELLVHIFWFTVDSLSTLNCRLLSRRYRDCIDASSLLQYAIRLDAWGYEDGGSGNSLVHSIFDRQKALETHIKSWATLDWEEHHVSVPYPETYKLVQGYLFTIHQTALNTSAVACVDLPSRLLKRATQVRTLPHVFDFPVDTFLVDPSQDILIAIEGYVTSPIMDVIQC